VKKSQKNTQIILLSIGVILFVTTYLYYPNLNKNVPLKNQITKQDFGENPNKDKSTTFEKMEYKGLYDFDKPFNVKSEKAFILNDNPDIVYMKKMQVTLYLANNRIVEISSLEGRYNKVNYNCYFEQEVVASDGDIIITADNLDLLATNNFVEIYNNVKLDNTTSALRADKIDYDFETKKFKVSMFDDKSVKMKVTR
jgi:lipopolysaccharide export system protein LptA